MMRILLRLMLLCCVTNVYAEPFPGVAGFVDDMVAKHGFAREPLLQLFESVQYRQSIIDAISHPSVTKPWPEYRAAFVNAQRINLGVKFWRKHQSSLLKAQRKYGVPVEIIVALIGVETIYGKHVGKYRVLDALATLAFHYPRRADFFRDELRQYLLLTRERGWAPLAVRGSYAGAMGVPQFMPSSFRDYAVDFNRNGKIDLNREMDDVIGSVANYMRQHAWVNDGAVAQRAQLSQPLLEVGNWRTVADWRSLGVSVSGKVRESEKAKLLFLSDNDAWLVFDNFAAVMRYNNSSFYAMTVWQLAEAIKQRVIQSDSLK